MKVLFLSAWYPHRYDAMAGLFVQKHAKAVNLYADVKVLYVHSDENISDFEIVDQTVDGLNEIIVYYPNKFRYSFMKRLKFWYYVKAHRKGFRYLKKKQFTPDIIHSNVLTYTGVVAYFYKILKKTPYLVSEHWSRYLPQNFSYKGFIHTKLTELVVCKAEYILPVSNILKQAMLNVGLHHPNYVIVDNVVDDFFFVDVEKEIREKKRLLHVSCFDERTKNVCGILNAVKKLSERRTDFEFIIIGTGVDFQKCIEYADSLCFPAGIVSFLGEKTPKEVALWFQNSDAFVFFSNYETAGVVVAESLSSGTPIIGTPTGIIPDVVDETNGFIVDFGDEQALCEKMDYMLDNLDKYNVLQIKENAFERYSFKNIGEKLYSIYSKILNN